MHLGNNISICSQDMIALNFNDVPDMGVRQEYFNWVLTISLVHSSTFIFQKAISFDELSVLIY